MIPSPDYSDGSSHSWDLSKNLELWWHGSSKRWRLSTSHSSTGDVCASIAVNLGTVAPAALLLQVANIRGAK